MAYASQTTHYNGPDVISVIADGAVADQLEAVLSASILRWKVFRPPSPLVKRLEAVVSGPLLVEYRGDEMSVSEQARIAEMLALRAEGGRVCVILHQSALDCIGPVFDLPGIEFCSWEGRESDPMTALDMIGVEDGMREDRYEAGIAQDTLESIRSEIGRLAETVARLLPEEHSEPRSMRKSERTSDESADMLRRLVRQRRARADFFPEDMFADPAWDILLDLAAARHEGKRVSVSSLCIAAAVPTTTGLRWIKALTDAGFLMRESDPEDGRRSFIQLTPQSANLMERYLDSIA